MAPRRHSRPPATPDPSTTHYSEPRFLDHLLGGIEMAAGVVPFQCDSSAQDLDMLVASLVADGTIASYDESNLRNRLRSVVRKVEAGDCDRAARDLARFVDRVEKRVDDAAARDRLVSDAPAVIAELESLVSSR